MGPFPSKEEMEKMSTKRLLSFKKKKLSHPYNDNNYYRLRGWFPEEDLQAEKAEYMRAYQDLKSVLATREHVKPIYHSI
jgi:hypothetical protein